MQKLCYEARAVSDNTEAINEVADRVWFLPNLFEQKIEHENATE